MTGWALDRASAAENRCVHRSTTRQALLPLLSLFSRSMHAAPKGTGSIDRGRKRLDVAAVEARACVLVERTNRGFSPRWERKPRARGRANLWGRGRRKGRRGELARASGARTHWHCPGSLDWRFAEPGGPGWVALVRLPVPGGVGGGVSGHWSPLVCRKRITLPRPRPAFGKRPLKSSPVQSSSVESCWLAPCGADCWRESDWLEFSRACIHYCRQSARLLGRPATATMRRPPTAVMTRTSVYIIYIYICPSRVNRARARGREHARRPPFFGRSANRCALGDPHRRAAGDRLL